MIGHTEESSLETLDNRVTPSRWNDGKRRSLPLLQTRNIDKVRPQKIVWHVSH
jgi:hypothetical protein